MVGFGALWLPVIASAVVSFLASCVIHMALRWHNSDMKKVPREDEVMDALRPFAIPPGDYGMPRPSSMKDMRSPEYTEKFKKGPVMTFTVAPSGSASMAKSLVLWFVYMLVVSVFAAYIAGRALTPGAEFRQVLRFAGATAFIGYCLALYQMSIWYGRSWVTTLKVTVDSLVYAFITGTVFGWLWPR